MILEENLYAMKINNIKSTRNKKTKIVEQENSGKKSEVVETRMLALTFINKCLLLWKPFQKDLLILFTVCMHSF